MKLQTLLLTVLSSGGVPAISVSPSSWDFGATPVGTPVTKEFTIENTGTGVLEITLPITIVDGDDNPVDGFTVTVDPDTSIAPGDDTTFTVRADADEVEEITANIKIISNAASSPTLVAIEVNVSETYADSFADFVARWKMKEASGTIADNDQYQTALGSEILANPTLLFSGGALTSWTEDESPPTYEVAENANGARLYSTGTAFKPTITQAVASMSASPLKGETWQVAIDIFSLASGTYDLILTGAISGNAIQAFSTDQVARNFIFTGNLTQMRLLGRSATNDAIFRSLSLKKQGEDDAAITSLAAYAVDSGNAIIGNGFDFNGTTSALLAYDTTRIKGLANLNVWIVLNADIIQANDVLIQKTDDYQILFNASDGTISAKVDYGTTDATAITNEGITAGALSSIGLKIDDTNKQISIFLNGVEATYASRVTGVGARASSTNNLNIGTGYDGKIYDLGICNQDVDFEALHNAAFA